MTARLRNTPRITCKAQLGALFAEVSLTYLVGGESTAVGDGDQRLLGHLGVRVARQPHQHTRLLSVQLSGGSRQTGGHKRRENGSSVSVHNSHVNSRQAG